MTLPTPPHILTLCSDLTEEEHEADTGECHDCACRCKVGGIVVVR
jgi:hypothetical protein